MTDVCQVSIACASADEAARIADALLDGRLAACVQTVGPIESHYWWHGQRETTTEWLCLAKTRVARVDDIVVAVQAMHSYDTPEIVATPIIAGAPDYLKWVASETSGRGS